MTWDALHGELDRWHESGRAATFWWRDDDAADRTPALDRLLGLSSQREVPVALAVVPGRATGAAAEAVSGAGACVLQHGWRHENQAPPDSKKCELVAGPDTERLLSRGLETLETLFGPARLPVLVPPWNRLDPALLHRLADLGYRGLSRFKPRRAATVEGLHQVNTHVDIMGWRSGRGFRGEEETLAAVLNHLKSRRESSVDADEPTGLLTHHLEHDEECWAFVDRFLERTGAHPASRWLDARQVFAVEPPPGPGSSTSVGHPGRR